MRVGVIGPLGGDELAENVADSLGRMGVEVIRLGPAHPSRRNGYLKAGTMLVRAAIPRLDERSQRDIARSALNAHCDVVINSDVRLLPEIVAQIRRGGARVALWYTDGVSLLGRQLMFLSPYDALFFKEPHIVERVAANLDLPAYYLPEACNPRWHRPLGPAGTEPHLVIAGTMYPIRVRLLERLLAKGIPLRLYGAGVPAWIGDTPIRAVHTGRHLIREEKAKVFRSAAGVLNTINDVQGVNARLFEATGSGAAVLSEFRPALPDLFSIGSQILAYRDFDELVDQATRLLNEAGLAGRLGDAASRRAHAEHSYDKRMTTILETLA